MSSADALTDVLKTIRLSGSTFFCTGFNTSWGMAMEAEDRGAFHVVVAGKCWLVQGNVDEPVELLAGDIVAFPTGGVHWISNSPTPSPQILQGREVANQIMSGGNPFWNAHEDDIENRFGDSSDDSVEGIDNYAEDAITLLCGTFHYDSSVDHPFV